MSLHSLIKIHLKRILTRKETLISFTLIMLLVCVSFIELCSHFALFESGALPNASYAWVGNMGVMQIKAMHVWFYLFLFLLSAAIYADALLLDSRSGMVNFLAIRTPKTQLVLSYLIASFIGGFLIVVIPLIISQLLSCIVFPLTGQPYGFQTMINEGIHLDNLEQYIASNVLFPTLYYNHPYILNAIYMLYAGLITGLVSSITCAITLIAKPKRLILLGIPSIVIITLEFLIPRSRQIQFYMYPSASLPGLSTVYFFAVPLVLLAILMLMMIVSRVLRRDYLL